MKRFLLSLALIAFAAVAAPAQESLADAARAQQSKKKTTPATHVYTNESMEFHPAPPEPAPAKDAKSGDAKTDAADSKDAPAGDADAPDAAAEKKKAADAIKEKYSKQQADLTQLQRELDVLVRENRLRAAQYYADAGAKLRDEAKFAADDRKYQADIAAKQKAIADGQANLDKIREEARRAGVPVS